MLDFDFECNFLPRRIHGDMSDEELIENAIITFKNDFCSKDRFLWGKKIVTQYPKSHKQTFAHILKLDDKNATIQTMGYRARMVPQILPLIQAIDENRCGNCVKIWKEFDTEHMNYKYIMLCYPKKLLLVFAENENLNEFILITAYYLSDGARNNNLESYQKSENKIM